MSLTRLALHLSQNLLRLAKPIIHTHLPEHLFRLFEVVYGLFFLIPIQIELAQVQSPED